MPIRESCDSHFVGMHRKSPILRFLKTIRYWPAVQSIKPSGSQLIRFTVPIRQWSHWSPFYHSFTGTGMTHFQGLVSSDWSNIGGLPYPYGNGYIGRLFTVHFWRWSISVIGRQRLFDEFLQMECHESDFWVSQFPFDYCQDWKIKFGEFQSQSDPISWTNGDGCKACEFLSQSGWKYCGIGRYA